QGSAGVGEVAAIEKLYETDYVAADAAASAIPDSLASIDREAVAAAALRTRADLLDPATQLDAALDDDALNWVISSSRQHVQVSHDHGQPRVVQRHRNAEQVSRCSFR